MIIFLAMPALASNGFYFGVGGLEWGPGARRPFASDFSFSGLQGPQLSHLQPPQLGLESQTPSFQPRHQPHELQHQPRASSSSSQWQPQTSIPEPSTSTSSKSKNTGNELPFNPVQEVLSTSREANQFQMALSGNMSGLASSVGRTALSMGTEKFTERPRSDGEKITRAAACIHPAGRALTAAADVVEGAWYITNKECERLQKIGEKAVAEGKSKNEAEVEKIWASPSLDF